MSAIILDLDNCIFDDSWRIPLIKWDCADLTERYENYHAAAYLDEPANQHLYVGVPHEIIIFTARPIIHQAMTARQLESHGCNWSRLFMRHTNCFTPSAELKEAQLVMLFESVPGIDILCAYDDREDVVQMYRSWHIPAEVCAIHGLRSM